jgi:hypothetical protein
MFYVRKVDLKGYYDRSHLLCNDSFQNVNFKNIKTNII